MEVLFEYDAAFESVSEVIFDPEWDLKPLDRLFLQTWFARLGIERTTEYERLTMDLLDYVRSGAPAEFLLGLSVEHPYFMKWFGKPLVGNPQIEQILVRITEMAPFLNPPKMPPFIAELQRQLKPLNIADTLQNIVGEPYPKPDAPLHYVISRFPSHPYNIYPDVVVNYTKGDYQWYVAGFGHEAGHLLTWDMCRDPEVKKLCNNDVTRNFPERIAELCSKLILDAYDIACHEAFPECEGWDEFMYEKNPGKPLFDKMVSEIQLGSYASLRQVCIQILRSFQ